MSITSAMFTGVSGLLANAEGMNVIGNNLSNINTIGFKSGRMLFSDMLSANLSSSFTSSQIGRGTQIQKVDNLFTQGSFESTENVTDLAIQGNSFFAVKEPSVSSPVNQNGAMLTRAGAFRIDSDLYLVNPDGYQVLDTQGNPIKFSDNSVGLANAATALSAQLSTMQTKATLLDTDALALVAAADAAVATAATNLPLGSGTYADLQAKMTQLDLDSAAVVASTVAGTPAEVAAANAADAAITTALASATAAAAPGATTAEKAQAIADMNAAYAAIGKGTGTYTTANVVAANNNLMNTANAAPYFPLADLVAKANALDTSAGILSVDATATGTPAEQVAAANLKATTAAALAAVNSAVATPADPTLAATALSALSTASAQISAASFTTPGLVTDNTNLNTVLTASPNVTTLTSDYNASALALNNALSDQTAANAIKAATATALATANLAVASPQNTALTTNSLTALNDASNLVASTTIKSPSVVASYITMTTDLAATPSLADLTSSINTATSAYSDQLGLAFGKILKVDAGGLISYLGKDGITVNYYNASGQVGVTASKANAATVQRLAIVNVADPNALDKAGNSLYKPTLSSGIPTSAFSLTDNMANGTSEKIFSNNLELSNVDMASQFVKMILTQRAYSANSKTITTADEMTQEVLNLKR